MKKAKHKKIKMKWHISGIRKIVLIYTVGILLFALVTATVIVNIIIHNYMQDVAEERYEYVNEKMKEALENSYKVSDDLTAEYISNSYIQKSLENQSLSKLDYSLLKKTLSYISFNDLSNIFYMDNKGTVYTRISNSFDTNFLYQSDLYQALGSDYSKTKWIWQKDTLFGTETEALFIGRFVRHMDYSHAPGVFFLKMSSEYFEHMLAGINKERDVAYLITDSNFNLCYSNYINSTQTENNIDRIRTELKKAKSSLDFEQTGMIITEDGIIFAQMEMSTSFYVVTYVPESVMNAPLRKMQFVIIFVILLLCIVSIVFCVYFSNLITKPVKKINSVMSKFDGKDFNTKLDLQTNTELDSIGQTYNLMIDKIADLIQENKENEQELRIAELNSLMYQLNPHFLYNTLDNIYMLARMKKEQRIMDMIQSLSKLLRISLSKGHDMIALEDELEHVKCYLDIQKIRNASLFDYSIECSTSLYHCKVLKLLLQPIVENGIKHGFCNIYEGGLLKIAITEIVKENEKYLSIRVSNNGESIEEHARILLNQMRYEDLSKIKDFFPQKQGGYGIANLVSRIRLKYQDRIEFYYQRLQDDKGTECIIVIPEILESNEE